jgi:serine/threonine protein kinase
MSRSKKIGEGTYGCVHKPSLKCKDNKIISDYNDKISKIMKNKHAQIEMKEYVGINRIDPTNTYHIKPQECVPDNNKETKESVLECNLGKDMVKKMDQYKLIVMKYGGPDLYNFFNNPMENTHKNRERVENFWIEAVNLLKAVQLFLKNGMIHHDLKPENIVYDESTHSLKVIDFGLLQMKNNIIKESNNGDYGYALFHFNFPPELFFYNKKKWFERKDRLKPDPKFKKKDDDDRFNNLGLMGLIRPTLFKSDYMVSLNTLVKYYLKDEEIKPLAKGEFLDFTEDFLSHNDTKTFDKYLNDSIDTIDSYGLGMSLMYVLNQSYKLMKPKIVSELQKLFTSMIHHDLRKRIRIDDALKQYESIIKISPPSPGVHFPRPNIGPGVPPNVAVESILPNGLIRKVGKKCPNGSKTYKYKGENVCKKHNVSIKIRNVPVHVPAPQLPSPPPSSHLPNNMVIKVGKRCPNGSKTHKYKDKIVCLKNV